jgi:hypothetical protein
MLDVFILSRVNKRNRTGSAIFIYHWCFHCVRWNTQFPDFFIYFFENVSGSVWLSLFINSWAYYEVRQYIEFSSPFCPKEWSLSINSDFFKILTFIEGQKYALYIIVSVVQPKTMKFFHKKKWIIKMKSKKLIHNTEVHIECLLCFN